jgi:hypothetical protein
VIKYRTTVTAKVNMTDFDAPPLELPGYWSSGRVLVVDSFSVQWDWKARDDEAIAIVDLSDICALFYGLFRLKSGKLGAERHDITLGLVTKGPEKIRAQAYVRQIIEEYPW